MKVLFVLDSLAPGGTERSTLALAPALLAHGIELSILTLKRAEHELDELAAAHGISVTRIAATGWVSRVRAVRRHIHDVKPDIVHTALYQADQVGRLAAVGTGVPVVSSFVNTPYDANRLADPNVRRWRLRALQFVDAITARLFVRRFHAVSEGTKFANARALRLPLERIVVAERGRDSAALGERSDERRLAVRAGLGLSFDAPVVLNLGRLEHQKAQVDLIAATASLSRALPDVVVLIAGKDGSASNAIRDALAVSPAADHVRLLGHRSDVGDLLCAADVLAISSHFEGTAGVALEAMALGTPIVATNVEGVQGVLSEGKNAVLVPVGSPPDLAAALERVLTDNALAARLAAAGLLDYEARFTLDAGAARLAEFYLDVA